MHPSSEQLNTLKSPMGQLIPGGPVDTMPQLKRLVEHDRPSKLVTVGDIVTRRARDAGIKVDIGIMDGKTLREEISEGIIENTGITLSARNPAGSITGEAWQTIKDAMREEKVTILIDGEEDLLALPALIEAPLGSMIVYGQPNKGIVVVPVTDEMKRTVSKMLESWKRK